MTNTNDQNNNQWLNEDGLVFLLSTLRNKLDNLYATISDINDIHTMVSSAIQSANQYTDEKLEQYNPSVSTPSNILTDTATGRLYQVIVTHGEMKLIDVTPSSASYFTTDGAGTITGLTDDAKTEIEIIIPLEINGVAITSIGDNAFGNYNKLLSIFIPISVTNIGTNAFNGCEKLNTVNYTGTEEQWNLITIEDGNELLVTAYENTISAAANKLINVEIID